MAAGSRNIDARARSRARRLAMQALYQWQLNKDHRKNIYNEFLKSDEIEGADVEYFRALIIDLIEEQPDLDAVIAEYADRDIRQLDPIEHAVLMIGVYELRRRPEVPYRVVINEAVELSKRFGALDGHKFVNALLDRAARNLRPVERTAKSSRTKP